VSVLWAEDEIELEQDRSCKCLRKKQLHCVVFIDSNEWLVIVM
jgi:hypothetical protein